MVSDASPSICVRYRCPSTAIRHNGGRSSVVRASEFKPEDPRFDPLAGQGEGQFFCPPRDNSCVDLFVPDPHFCVRHAPKFVCTLKIPYLSVVKG